MNELISGLVGGGIAIALMAILWSQTNSIIDGKANRDVCEVRHQGLDQTLLTIQETLTKIDVTQSKLTSTVMEFMGQRRHDSEE
jgi:hypothetical protein